MNKLVFETFKQCLCQLGIDTPCFNLRTAFKNHLVKNQGMLNIKADEVAYKYEKKLDEIFDEVQSHFECAGVQCPYLRLDSGLILSYKSDRFESDLNWHEYKEIYHMIIDANPKQLLLLAGLTLIADGNVKVVINDGSNDGGVDLIAKDKNSTYNCKVIFAQVKKTSNSIQKELVIYEHANFWDEIIRKDRLKSHYTCVDVNSDSIAVETSYHFFTNGELSQSALSFARSRTIKVRLAREICASLSKKFNARQVNHWMWLALNNNMYRRLSCLNELAI
ncbi:hypothetical protein ACUVJH_00540 [Aeromonas veronii]|uniref:hypothetical protein n=1 Tax=Aeromonas veronii TaxID=654 RepID=UPI003BA39B52